MGGMEMGGIGMGGIPTGRIRSIGGGSGCLELSSIGTSGSYLNKNEILISYLLLSLECVATFPV